MAQSRRKYSKNVVGKLEELTVPSFPSWVTDCASSGDAWGFELKRTQGCHGPSKNRELLLGGYKYSTLSSSVSA